MPKKQNTDKAILDLIKLAKEKKEQISSAEKPNWKTNCSFRFNPENSSAINLQVSTDVNQLIGILGFLYTQESTFDKAANDLGVTGAKFKWGGSSLADWKSDIQTRITKIQITAKKNELDIINERLNKLISPELRAQIELEEITALLAK